MLLRKDLEDRIKYLEQRQEVNRNNYVDSVARLCEAKDMLAIFDESEKKLAEEKKKVAEPKKDKKK